MKNIFLIILSLLIVFSHISTANAASNRDLTEAIKLYKSGNYTECYFELKDYLKKDSSNVLAYYYLAMSSAQVGRSEEAISNYSKVLSLSNKTSNLYRYANKGKICLEEPDKCDNALYSSSLEAFINNNTEDAFSDEVKSKYEQLKIENLMREINRSKEMSPDKFKEYRDFSTFLMDDNSSNSNDVFKNPLLIQTMLTKNMALGF